MEGDLPVASFLLLFGYFNPLPPHGGRLKGEYSFFAFPEISIHSLRMEGDTFVTLLSIFQKSFQSTPSAWRETSTYKHTAEQSGISIHSLRMEGDRKAADPRLPGCAISIHSLRMEGDMATSYVPSGTSLFQSTPSAWRETEIVPTLRLSKYISIHSLRMEGDVSFLLRFQSMCISIHSLRMEGDYKIVLNGTYGISISIHSLRMEGDI